MAKILIVEDNEELQKVYKEVLEDEGYKVLQAFSGQQGLQMIANNKPNLVILDIMLPKGMNGFDVLEAMKKDENMKNIPIVVLTNLDSEKKVALEIGANDYLVKAYTTLGEVVAKVKKYAQKDQDN